MGLASLGMVYLLPGLPLDFYFLTTSSHSSERLSPGHAAFQLFCHYALHQISDSEKVQKFCIASPPMKPETMFSSHTGDLRPLFFWIWSSMLNLGKYLAFLFSLSLPVFLSPSLSLSTPSLPPSSPWISSSLFPLDSAVVWLCQRSCLAHIHHHTDKPFQYDNGSITQEFHYLIVILFTFLPDIIAAVPMPIFLVFNMANKIEAELFKQCDITQQPIWLR